MPLHRTLRSSLCLAAALLPVGPALAASGQLAAAHDNQGDPIDLAAVQVRAIPLADTADHLVTPVEILSGEALDRAKAGTLGETVAGLPGIQNASFGPGVGRPIIRGLEGARVQILSDGLGTGDVSTISADHAIAIEPFLADRIEVLKGPATLLYGSGAIGGAVNVIDGRIHERLPDSPVGGLAEWRAASGNRERTGMVRLDGAAGQWALHADALHREAGDIGIPGPALASGRVDAVDGGHAHGHRRLDNTALRTDSGALGVSRIGARGFAGASVSIHSADYGIPGSAHAQAHHDGTPGDMARVRIRLDQQRTEVRAGLEGAGALASLRLKMADSGYTHTEFEDGVPDTVFRNQGQELRAELTHRTVAGWQGAVGVQLARRDFSADGSEAFVPASLTRQAGVFWLGRREAGALHLEVGARHEQVQVTASGLSSKRKFDANSVSAGATWHVSRALQLAAGIDRAVRAPTAEELHSSGLHVATGGFERGDAGLRPERASRVEVGMHWHDGPLQAAFTGWHARYADFIHLAGSDAVIEGAPLRLWRQAPARFHGWEASVDWTIANSAAGSWQLGVFADSVRGSLAAAAGTTITRHVAIDHDGHAHEVLARVAAGGNLPRMAPARLGARLALETDAWRAAVGVVRTSRQDHIAAFETPTPGYALVDAHLAWHRDGAGGRGLEVFLDASNLGNRLALPHTSFLKDVAPLPGRSVAVGIRTFF